jgi:hypothetical protein
MPVGFRGVGIVRAKADYSMANSPFLDKDLKGEMRRWWLAHDGNIPNWDLIVQATSGEGPALVLIEAKAHVGEFDRKPKSKAHRDYPDAQLRTNDNHLQIRRAIEEAAKALSKICPRISADRHYQLSNRIAMARKLASLGIPNALVFLGFTGDCEIAGEGEYFADDCHWAGAFSDYIAGTFPLELLDTDIPSGSASFRVLSRSLPATRLSRPIAERRMSRRKFLQR